jgi:hypothetical protein
MIPGTIPGTDTLTVTDILTGKQLPQLRGDGFRCQRAAGRLQLAAGNLVISDCGFEKA